MVRRLRKRYDATLLHWIYGKADINVEAEKMAVNSSLVSSILQTWSASGFDGIKEAIDSGLYLFSEDTGEINCLGMEREST